VVRLATRGRSSESVRFMRSKESSVRGERIPEA
jgi:hypothetical protein